MKHLLTIVAFLMLSNLLIAQTCGTAEPSTNPIPAKMHPAYKMFTKNFVPNGSRSMLLDTVPYKIHVVRTSAGTGGISTTDLTSAFNIVNGYYANANLYFKQCGAINYIDNSTYYDFFTSDEANITGANNVTNVINIYFFNTVTTSAGSSLCGYAYFPGGADVIVMKNSCAINGSTLSHEIGHYFGLYHTHSTSNGTEYVNGTNCSTTGDLLCDTPADPTLGTSNVNTSCVYTGTATDPLGATYTPDPTNIMSYSRKTCRTYMSPQQYARIAFTNLNQRSYLSCSSGSSGSGLINGCASASQYPAATLTPTTSWQTNSNLYAGEYSIYNVVSGQTYEWSTCAADGGLASYDTELTLTDLSNNELAYSNDACGSQSKIVWTSTITGTVRVHLTEDHCQSNTTGTNIVYKYQSGSPNLTKQTDNLIVSGNSVTVSATIENTGTSGAGSFDVRFYASTNTIISTGDIPIYTENVSSLLTSGTTTVGSTIDLCAAGLTNGSTYYIGYIIDYNNDVTESNENDNIFAWATQSTTLNCTSGCLGTSQYPSGTFTPTTTWQTASSNIYAGEYSVYNVVAGTTYEWSLCTVDGGSASYDSELTLTDASNNFLAYEDDFCGDDAKITWVSTITGTVRVHVTQYSCQTNSISTTLVYQSVGGGSGSPNLTKQTDNLTVSGNLVTMSATIENTGTASAGSFDVRFYASTNTIISTGDNPIYTATVNSLAASATTTVGSTIDLCLAGLTNGTTYYIGYIIDYNNNVTESNESDNTFAWTTQSVTLNCNTGCLGTSQYPSGTFTPTTTWQTASSNIYAGEYSVYNVVAGTTYEWSLCTVDGGSASYDSELTLTDASNNFLAYEDDFCGDDAKITWVSTITGTVRVHVTQYSCQTNSISTTLVYKSVGGGSGSPNLLSAGGGTMSTTGTTVSVTANIQNNGTGAAGAFNVRFYASTNTTISTGDTEIYASSIASLASNTTTQVTFSVDLCNIPGFSPSGNYYIGFLIDEPDQVTESNETDNGSYFTSPISVTCVTNYTITTNVNPLGTGTVTGSGTYSSGSSATVTATANPGWVFDSWKENGVTFSNNASYTFTVTTNRTLEAVFTQVQYTITTSASPTAGGTTAGGGSYNNGSTATVSATATPGWTFDSWQENGAFVSNNFSYTFTVIGNRNLVAVFTQQQYNITTSANPTAGGTTSGGGTYLDGSSVTVIATPNSGWAFGSWEENGNTVSSNATYTFIVGSNRTLTATFVQQQYTITTNASPLNGGSITGGGTYNGGSSATLTATPNSGWVFDSWKENGVTVSNNATYIFTVTGNRTLDATFVQQQYTISMNASPTNGGTMTGGGTYNSGSSATVTAISSPGWMFAAWQENGSTVWTDSVYTFVVTSDRTFDVLFDLDVSANGLLNDVEINVSPNPTSDLVNIVIEHPTFDFDKIQVYNIHGQLMQESNMNRDNSIQLDLGSLSEGVYFVQIFTLDNQQFLIKKVIKTN
ncbi:MAG: CARDB domain-containing protein [Saprospiraceae bacterium]